MNSGVKFFIFMILGIVPFFITSYLGFILLLSYLLVATILTKIKISMIIKSIIAYMIIIILPYTIGLLMVVLISKITGGDLTTLYNSFDEVALRLFKLFILWYVSLIFFNSTSTEVVLGLFAKLLSPLNKIGVPVLDFLKVIMCVINELKELAPDVKRAFSESVSQIFNNKKGLSKGSIKGISHVLVSFIVNSFQRLGKVEEYVKQLENKELFNYKFSLTRVDFLAVFSLILLLGGITFLEYF
jgi:energy-coupling factor transporter transmembrane protein EcfT